MCALLISSIAYIIHGQIVSFLWFILINIRAKAKVMSRNNKIYIPAAVISNPIDLLLLLLSY
jgi:hypothetical protein